MTSISVLRSRAHRRWNLVSTSLALVQFLGWDLVGVDPLCQWESRSSASIGQLVAIAFGGDVFVGIGPTGSSYTSIDGSVWQLRNTSLTNAITSIAFGKGAFVGVGGGAISGSSNAVDWVERRSATNEILRKIIFANDVFVAVGERLETLGTETRGTGLILTSVDGMAWAAQNIPSVLGSSSATFGQNLWVASAWDATNGVILVSSNLADWKLERSLPPETYLSDLAYGRGRFIGVGSAGGSCSGSGGGAILTSTDGKRWASDTTGGSGVCSFAKVIFAQDTFLAVGNYGGRGGSYGLAFSSTEGLYWPTRLVARENLFGAAYGKNTLLLIGSNGTLLQSGNLAAPPGPPRFNLEHNFRRSEGVTHFGVEGRIGHTVTLEASADLSSWGRVNDTLVTECITLMYDAGAPDSSVRFYRLKQSRLE